MNRRLLSFAVACLVVLSSAFAQNQETTSYKKLSATPAPPQQWKEWFNKEVEKFKELRAMSKDPLPNHTIPVIFHVLHSGQAIGTDPNISQARIQSQIDELNFIYNGMGSNPTSITHYSDYVANPGINFCLAVNDPTNIPLGEPGIDRMDLTTMFTANTNTFTSDAQLTSFLEYTVKPATIWDPTKYLNIWLCEKSPSITVLGGATYPAGANLLGMGAVGTGTTDGVWCIVSAVGGGTNTGSEANYGAGKTLAREIGHWLGVLNIWGDAVCGTDYCNDTPPANGPNTSCPGSYPHDINSCGSGLSPFGEMTMNIMDYTPDNCRYMFTTDQAYRMQAAMSQCYFRYQLGSHALCTSTTVTYPAGGAYASFFIPDPGPCFGKPFTAVNTSTGSPTPSYTWVLTPNTATVSQGYNVASPSINLANQGDYTLTLIASNSLATTEMTYTFSTFICPNDPTCLDTLIKLKNTDTLSVYSVNSNTAIIGCNVINPGFLTGTNCYKDKEFAQYFAANLYSNTPVPQLSGVLVLFNRAGTKANSSGVNVYCNVWGGDLVGGPVTLLTQKPEVLSNITVTTQTTWSTTGTPTNSVPWCGEPTYTLGSNDIYIHKFEFDPPYLLPTNGFHVGVEMPWTSAVDSCQIFSNSIFNAPVGDSSAFVRSSTDNWLKMFKERGKNVQLAIMPIITCKAKVGLNEYNNSIENNLVLIPNPNNGVFNLATSFESEETLTIKVLNYLGQEIQTVRKDNVTKEFIGFDLSTYPNGVYIIDISNGQSRSVKKFIISK